MVHIHNLFFTILVASIIQLARSGVVQDPKARNLSSGSLNRRAITPNSEGTVGSYYYRWWSDGGADPATYVNYLPGIALWVPSRLHPLCLPI